MKQIFYFFVCILFSYGAFAQSPFWTETFSVGCNNGQVASGFNPSGMGTWSVTNTGTNNPESNVWYVSASEQGVGIGNCGQGCGGNQNRTLHVGANLTNPFPLVDQGATYAAGTNYNTDRRAESPIINCTGHNTITLTFAYILGGIPGSDYFNVQYSANGGTTWSVIGTPAITNNSVCGGQGLWTGYTVALPASANNNPNVKVGFRWMNSDTTGNDPSVAIDDVTLLAITPSTFAPTFTIASPICSGNSVTVMANTGTFAVSGYTWSASPAGPGIASPNSSVTGISFPSSGTYSITLSATSGGTTATNVNTILVNATPVLTVAASSNTLCAGSSATLSAMGAPNYTWNPGALTGSNVVVTPSASITYTAIGTNTAACTGSAAISLTISNCSTGLNQLTLNNSVYNVYPNPASDKIYIQASGNISETSYEISDALGKVIMKSGLNGSTQAINISQLPSGIYLVKITSGNETKALRFVKE